ncbi:hypothetical protein CBR_g22319 [Chara braunii]|uniref:RNA-directed DNA polymerase n=1 Tax=Chara braunii TaxID=69332 RepID=A0A388JUY0_CHABU|nr:hypothetical protein CBR_g22319 [Chara braunii]|eukprot:GBG61522.1 hypothetical protein CBR_g22319 [Chara braunii]
MLLRSQTAIMDQKPGETAEAYQARMLVLIAKAKQRLDAVAAAEKKKAEDVEKARLLAIEQQRQHDEAAAKAADEERSQRREKVFSEERALLTMAAAWRTEAEGGEFSDSGPRISLLLSHLTDLLAMCIAQEEDIHNLDDTVKNQQRSLDEVNSRLQQLEQRPVANSSNTSDRLNALEVDHVTMLIDSDFDGQEIFCDATKTNPIPWFRQFKLKLQLHHVHEAKHDASLYSRSGGACQAWMGNLFSKYSVVAADLHTKISWADLKAAWHKQFQIEPPEMRAMNKLIKFHQNTLPSGDWIAEFQRLAAMPSVPMGFQAVKHYFILRSCSTLSTTLTQVANMLTTTAELFDKAAQITITNTKAKNLSPTTGLSREQHRPKVAVVAAATSIDPSSEAVSGDRLAAARDGGRPGRGRGRGYVRIQVGQAACSALLDSSASRNFMSQAFMQRAGLGAQVQRKANPTTIKLAEGKTQQLLDRYIEAVLVYFAPHACELVTFDFLDTDFDIILGMPWLASADHTVNFHRRTLTVWDAFGAEVSCIIPLPHPSIQCQVVTTKSFRATCAYEQLDEIGLCFLRTVAVACSSPTNSSSDPPVVRLLDEFADIFESSTGVVPDRPISHEIILETGVVPLKGCIYHMSEEELTVLSALLDDLLDKGWIPPSSSLYGAPTLFVWKKNKDLRLCIDSRKLNAQTVKNVGPLPRIDDLLEQLGGAKYFSKLDLKSGYHQISIRLNNRYKSAFKTWYGHFEWVVMPSGLTNAPTTIQAAMTNEFRAMLDRFVLVYLDGILVYSRTLEDHLEHLRRVLETLRRAKCEFVRQELEYLGHFVTPEGISPLSDKIQAIQEWPEPRNVTYVRSFLGLAGNYQHFIKGYSKIAAHLTKLQCEDRPFDFGEDARESFLPFKAALLSAEVLHIYASLLPTRVTTDASGYGIGAILEQHNGVDWHPVEYFNKKVPVVHSIDDARKKELLAFVHKLKRWRHFLLGRSQFRWVTDNNPLVFYKTQDTVNSTIARWMTFIDQFDFFPDHIPRKSNHFADALSRCPDHCTAVYSTFEIDDDLRDSFIRGYQADPEFRDKYANCSSPNPAPSHCRIQEGYLLVHTRGKDLCVPSDSHLCTRLLAHCIGFSMGLPGPNQHDTLFNFLQYIVEEIEGVSGVKEMEMRSKVEQLRAEMSRIPSTSEHPLGELEVASQLDKLEEKLTALDEMVSQADPEVRQMLSQSSNLWMPVICSSAAEREENASGSVLADSAEGRSSSPPSAPALSVTDVDDLQRA